MKRHADHYHLLTVYHPAVENVTIRNNEKRESNQFCTELSFASESRTKAH